MDTVQAQIHAHATTASKGDTVKLVYVIYLKVNLCEKFHITLMEELTNPFMLYI